MVFPPGISVRAINQATITDNVSEGMRRTVENRKLNHSALNVGGSEKARPQLSVPRAQGCPGAAVLKLLISMKVIGSAITMQKKSSTASSARTNPRSLGSSEGAGAVIVLIVAEPSRGLDRTRSGHRNPPRMNYA